jgi:release factor glutamine methyltransferase
MVDLIIRENPGFRGNIVDIGTGSGCIAVSLAANLQGTSVTGIDISEEAIEIARGNALLNNVAVKFIRSDLFRHDLSPDSADIIVSNPPYVRDSERQFMSKSVIDFEPHTALFVPDDDPLVFYRGVLDMAGTILVRGGRLYFEINEAMGESMAKLLQSSGYHDIKIIKDINNRDRILKAIKNG